MKQIGVFLLPPGSDASPPQGYSPTLNSERGITRVNIIAQEHNTMSLGQEPGPFGPMSGALTMRPSRLQSSPVVGKLSSWVINYSIQHKIEKYKFTSRLKSDMQISQERKIR